MCVLVKVNMNRMTGYSVGFEGGRKGWTGWSLLVSSVSSGV